MKYIELSSILATAIFVSSVALAQSTHQGHQNNESKTETAQSTDDQSKNDSMPDMDMSHGDDSMSMSHSMSSEHHHPMGPSDCGEIEVWDYAMAMCMPLPMAGMPMKMLMVHGNSFFIQTAEEKPRGRDAFSVPNMFMADIGTSVGDHHYINLDFMGTLEKWTFPKMALLSFCKLAKTRPMVHLFWMLNIHTCLQ